MSVVICRHTLLYYHDISKNRHTHGTNGCNINIFRKYTLNHLRYDFPEDDQPRHAFILIKPGHFDMLYAKVRGDSDRDRVRG